MRESPARARNESEIGVVLDLYGIAGRDFESARNSRIGCTGADGSISDGKDFHKFEKPDILI